LPAAPSLRRLSRVRPFPFAATLFATLAATLTDAAGTAPGAGEQSLRAHVEFLADDLLEGRATGTRGYDIAARYVATQFAQAGLEPAGDAGGWLQKVPFIEGMRVSPAATFRIERGGQSIELKSLEDFVPGIDFVSENAGVSGELVFVGFGVTAPELGYDDFANVDARGRIAVVLGGAPARFEASQRAFYSSGVVKNANLVKHGVVGVLTASTPEDDKRVPWDRVVQQAWVPAMRWVDAKGEPVNAWPTLKSTASISRPTLQRLFEGAPQSLDAAFAAAERGEPQAFALPGRAELSRRTALRRVESANVVGLLRGSDPKLRDEYVVLTAHLDHLGRGAAVGGDSIYNGAMDNATGVAVMIEVARALAALPKRPRRSVLFVAVTAEEKGLLGSEYFAMNPPVPRDSLIANINMDMPVALTDLAEFIGFGAPNSTLGPAAERAAAAEGMRLVPDPRPEETFFVRSDQYSFVRQGVPSLYIDNAERARDPKVDGARLLEDFLRNHYHQPSDDASQPIHYGTLARLVRVNVRIVTEVANARDRPRWNPGDFFGTRFGNARNGGGTR
jgi:hypothetical protein